VNLTGGQWNAVGTAIVATGASVTSSVSFDVTAQRFFRIRLAD